MGFKEDIARIRVEQGAESPYDAPDNWRINSMGAKVDSSFDLPSTLPSPPPATDWAHAAARGVMAELSDRTGIKNHLNVVEESVRVELVEALADIIRHADKHSRVFIDTDHPGVDEVDVRECG